MERKLMIKNRELLFSITANDCNFDYYVGSGKGGQKRNKTHNCVRCSHEPSGSVGKAEEGRSQRRNKESAFKRMAESNEFKKWHKMEIARRMGTLAEVESTVERSMQPKNLKIEIKTQGKWVKEK